MNEMDAVAALGALAQDTRLRIFRALVQAGPDGLTAGSLGERVGAAPNTLSFHLRTLCHAGLLTQQRDGRHLIYRADFARMNALLGYLTEHCCGGQPCGEPVSLPGVCQTC